MITRQQEIINQLNDLERERDDVGETFIDVMVDAREDDGLPPFTPEELAAAQEECDRNLARENDLIAAIDALKDEYFDLTGDYPVAYGSLFTTWRDPRPWERWSNKNEK